MGKFHWYRWVSEFRKEDDHELKSRSMEGMAVSAEHMPQTWTSLYAGRNRVYSFVANGREWVAKMYKVPNIFQGVAYRWFTPCKAWKACRYAARLQELGIRTPEPVCAFVEESPLGIRRSYFVSARCYDAPLYPVLVEAETFDRELADALAGFLVEMHQKGFLHGDLNLTNILYHKSVEGVQFTVIDINRSKFIANPTQAQCLKNLVRLTHRHDLFEYVVRAYARLRGWNEAECATRSLSLLNAYERHLERKRRIKRLFR